MGGMKLKPKRDYVNVAVAIRLIAKQLDGVEEDCREMRFWRSLDKDEKYQVADLMLPYTNIPGMGAKGALELIWQLACNRRIYPEQFKDQ